MWITTTEKLDYAKGTWSISSKWTLWRSEGMIRMKCLFCYPVLFVLRETNRTNQLIYKSTNQGCVSQCSDVLRFYLAVINLCWQSPNWQWVICRKSEAICDTCHVQFCLMEENFVAVCASSSEESLWSSVCLSDKQMSLLMTVYARGEASVPVHPMNCSPKHGEPCALFTSAENNTAHASSSPLLRLFGLWAKLLFFLTSPIFNFILTYIWFYFLYFLSKMEIDWILTHLLSSQWLVMYTPKGVLSHSRTDLKDKSPGLRPPLSRHPRTD